MSGSANQPQLARSPWSAALIALAAGCTGSLAGHESGETPPVPSDVAAPGPAPAAGVDPGRVAIHRLNNTEYNNTVRDLLGTSSQPASTFLAEEGFHFDNTATALGMTPGQYEGYFKAADDLMVEALASESARALLMSCTPSQPADPCARRLIEAFGMKSYRRPLEPSEVERAIKVYDAELARSLNGSEALAQALRAMLSAANFLYRIEHDPLPASGAAHSLSGYELASRLSYLHWSSMPDPSLFEAAKSGQLLDPAVLEGTVDRLLADSKAQAFVESFAGQWLDIRKLFSHSVTPQLFPSYGTPLADAMMAEGYLWFQEFLSQDRPLTDWFTADFNYVNDVLSRHYGFTVSVSAGEFSRVAVTTDQRRGFLGLSSFLTHTSFPSRTSPTLRGAWVLSELLCQTLAQPPGVVPELDESAVPTDVNLPKGSENVRERLERHRADPACNSCHQILDPIGLGLERYDAVGSYREAYGNLDPITPAGVLPDGTAFAGPEELAEILAQDPRFSACVASKLFTYALGREAEELDALTLEKLHRNWAARGLTLRNLLKEVVVSDSFRFRRGEPE